MAPLFCVERPSNGQPQDCLPFVDFTAWLETIMAIAGRGPTHQTPRIVPAALLNSARAIVDSFF
jgi:hypothetical protein